MDLATYGASSTPVVFAGGLFSEIQAWEDDGDGLASQMANEGWDVWKIEMRESESCV